MMSEAISRGEWLLAVKMLRWIAKVELDLYCEVDACRRFVELCTHRHTYLGYGAERLERRLYQLGRTLRVKASRIAKGVARELVNVKCIVSTESLTVESEQQVARQRCIGRRWW